MDMATERNRGAMEDRLLFLKTYRTDGGVVVHDSETCLVIIAEDVPKQQRVALKLMEDAEQWQREKDMRLLDDGHRHLAY